MGLGSDQKEADHMRSDHTGSAREDSDHTGSAREGSDHMGSDHMGSDHTGSDHTGSDHMGSDPARKDPVQKVLGLAGRCRSLEDPAASSEAVPLFGSLRRLANNVDLTNHEDDSCVGSITKHPAYAPENRFLQR